MNSAILLICADMIAFSQYGGLAMTRAVCNRLNHFGSFYGRHHRPFRRHTVVIGVNIERESTAESGKT
jgi:hypothetical protein